MVKEISSLVDLNDQSLTLASSQTGDESGPSCAHSWAQKGLEKCNAGLTELREDWDEYAARGGTAEDFAATYVLPSIVMTGCLIIVQEGGLLPKPKGKPSVS